eukprot:708422-Rhodomonas_salina.2
MSVRNCPAPFTPCAVCTRFSSSAPLCLSVCAYMCVARAALHPCLLPPTLSLHLAPSRAARGSR